MALWSDGKARISRARVAARPRSRLAHIVQSVDARITNSLGQLPLEAGESALDNGPLADGEANALFERHQGQLVHKWRQYPDIYDREFGPFRDGFPAGRDTKAPLRFLEIGVSEGGSQTFWRNYFGPAAVIFGIDVEPSCADVVDPSDGIVRIGSQDDPEFLRAVVAEMGGLDLVLDDGSHVASHQSASFATLWPLLSDGGVYLIEDTQTAYWPRYEGGLNRRGTAIEEAKALVDDMHRWHYRELGSDVPFGPEVPDVWAVSFYDSVIAIHKRKHGAPKRFTRGTQTRESS